MSMKLLVFNVRIHFLNNLNGEMVTKIYCKLNEIGNKGVIDVKNVQFMGAKV